MKTHRIPQPDDISSENRRLPQTVHAAARWPEHDLLVRRFQNAGLVPEEIAVVLNSKGLKVRTWHVSESLVRNRLKVMGLTPKASRLYFQQSESRYRAR